MNVNEFLGQFQDSRRHSLTIDCQDWDNILSALKEVLPILNNPSVEQKDKGNLLRVFHETIYVMGYYRGKREANPLTFIVKEPNETRQIEG